MTTSRVKKDERKRSRLEATDPYSILGLCESLTNLNSASMQLTVNRYFQLTTGSGVVFLVTLLDDTEEAIIQVVGDQILDREMRFPLPDGKLYRDSFLTDLLSKGKAHKNADSHQVHRNKIAKIPQPYPMTGNQSPAINQELLTMLQCVVPQSAICLTVPVLHPVKNTVAILVCLVDYQRKDNDIVFYTKHVEETFRFCLTTILNTIAYEEEVRLKRQCQSLLAVARKLFSHLGDLSDLLRGIMSEARQLTKAERCSLFLLDPDHLHLVAKVFDGITAEDSPIKEVRITKDQGIAGHVAATGKVLNIRDAYRHPLFFKGMDETTGFKTRNILCFPIRDENGIVGVAQLCNKMDGLYFDVFDEEVALAFSIYCGISIMHSIVYKKIHDAQARSKLSNELMMYHMKVSNSDIKTIMSCKSAHDNALFEKLNFSPRDLPTRESVCYTLTMFKNLDLLNKFKIKQESMIRFILFCKKGYRETPYHNWMHAFSVAHFAYLCLINFQLVERNFITDLEALAFLVACLCHDLDHRGTNNTFQTQSGSILASLYSSDGSVMERHHLSQAICILNTEGCNIFENVPSKEYSRCLDCIRDCILATDLAHHCRIFKNQTNTITTGFDKTSAEHKHLLMCMLMTCSDLSDQTKEWSVTKRIAELIYTEFFSQGDLEKSMGNKPLEMMDREKASIPDLQIQFLNTIVIPVFKLLTKLFPNAQGLLDAVDTNRDCWEMTKPVFDHYCRRGSSAIEVLKSQDLDKIKKNLHQAS